MLSLRLVVVSVLMMFSLVGCSSSSSGEQKTSSEPSGSLTVESIQKDETVVKSEDELVDTLTPLARSLDENAFIEEAINTLIPSLVSSYVPEGYEEEVLAQEELQTDALKSNEFFTAKVREYYAMANENQRADVLTGLSNIVSDLSTMVYDFIYNYFFGPSDSGSDEDGSIFDDVIDWVWGSDDDDTNGDADVNITDPSGNGGQLVSEQLGFTYDMLKGKTFYVVSSKADMTVEMKSDGKSGSGSMGFISMDFTDVINDSNIDIATSLMGDWIIKMTYLDSDHCIAADTVDESGTVYKSYWFLNSSDRSSAKTVSQAQAICYQHGWVGGGPTAGNGVDESDLVDIEASRDGFEVKTGDTTKEIVNKLVNEPTNTADVEDAKFFTRSLRHSALSLYTTNDKPDTVEAYETEIMSRELMPLAGSSLLQMKELAGNGMDSTQAFATEMKDDLNASLDHLSARLSALATSASTAMDNTISDDDYRGSDTTSYGDKVEFWITDMDVNVCLVFFLCESSVDATVHFAITNNGTNGNTANVKFYTRINAESMNVNAINFSKVISEQATNMFSANGYSLDFDQFEFNRDKSTLSIKGDGDLKEITSSASKTVATFSEFDVFIQLKRQSADITDYAMVSGNFSLDGGVNTKDGRTFDGALTFDAKNTASNKMNGTLVGINDEPTVTGEIKTTLSYSDILGDTGSGAADVSISSNLPYFVKSNGSFELVANFYEQFGKYQAETFERDKYECTKASSTTYNCSGKYSNSSTRTLKLTQEGDVLTINTTQGDYHISDIKNVSSQSTSDLILVHADDGSSETLDSYDFDKAQVNNIRLTNHSANTNNTDDGVTIDNIGNHSYSMNMKITKDSQLLEMYVNATRDTSADTWGYLITGITMENEYGTLKADEVFIKEEGSFRFADELDALIIGNVIGDYDLGVDGLFGLGWGDFESIKEIKIEALEMTMNTNGADTAKVNIDSDIKRTSNLIKGTTTSAYSYDQTALTLESDFEVAVSGSGDDATFTPNLTASGTVKSADIVDYTYAIEVEDTTRYILLSNDESTYQQGFVMNTGTIAAADSYGVKATLTTADEHRTITKVSVTNKSAESLGTYDKSLDAQKITYKDGVSEYLYIH